MDLTWNYPSSSGIGGVRWRGERRPCRNQQTSNQTPVLQPTSFHPSISPYLKHQRLKMEIMFFNLLHRNSGTVHVASAWRAASFINVSHCPTPPINPTVAGSSPIIFIQELVIRLKIIICHVIVKCNQHIQCNISMLRLAFSCLRCYISLHCVFSACTDCPSEMTPDSFTHKSVSH